MGGNRGQTEEKRNVNGAKPDSKESDNNAGVTDDKTLSGNGTKTENSGEDTKTDAKIAAETDTETEKGTGHHTLVILQAAQTMV